MTSSATGSIDSTSIFFVDCCLRCVSTEHVRHKRVESLRCLHGGVDFGDARMPSTSPYQFIKWSVS